MRYVFSDIHGKYDLFSRLLEKIGLTAGDTVYICGDVIDKGEHSLKTLRLVCELPNAKMILGNHEDMFLKYYRSLMSESSDFDYILEKLRGYFPCDGDLLDFELMDFLEGLPIFIREPNFICVHAGIPTDSEGRLLDPKTVSPEILLNDRRFKEPTFRHESPECVFFGHTQTNGISGQDKILAYLRDRKRPPKDISDFYKIHLDTGAWCSGVLGCFCIDSLRAFYVSK
jgi:hypothetical protein